MYNENEVSTRMALRERPKKQQNEKKGRDRDELKFLEDFNPEQSNREKRKLKRKVNASISKNSAYDEYGNIRHSGLDICDCLQETCPGCFYPCDNCSSNRCGTQCRVNRKFYYENIKFDGKDTKIVNEYFTNPNSNTKK